MAPCSLFFLLFVVFINCTQSTNNSACWSCDNRSCNSTSNNAGILLFLFFFDRFIMSIAILGSLSS